MIQKQRPKRRRYPFLPQLIFLVLIFLTAVGGTYFALQLFGSSTDTETVPAIITVEVIVTATPAPRPLAAEQASTLPANQVELPANLDSSASPALAATIDAARIGAVDAAISTPTVEAIGLSLTDNCEFHTVQSGDTPFGIAERWGANPYQLLEVNNLTLETATTLQIGDRLIVPLPGCNLDGQTLGSSAIATASSNDLQEIDITLASTEGLGDITSEGIRLRNTGPDVNISGWTLQNADGSTYTFPGLLLFEDAVIAIYSRSGTSTEGALFWGSDISIWQAGERIYLRDSDGILRKSLLIPSDE